MVYYGKEVIDDLLGKVNIVDLIGHYVKLKKKGSSYFGLCPFHSEKTASFSVSEEKQMYYCFGCHAGGNAISFVMNYENLDFVEAVQTIAGMYSISLPEESSGLSDNRRYSEKQTVYEINKKAANFYYKELLNDPNKTGIKYFANRGLSHETVKEFGLGYASKGRNVLYAYLKDEGYKDSELLKTGLFIADEKNGMTDRFWNRVMFPILDKSKNIIGFGGRVLGEGLPKYLNSPESDYFQKRKNLFGFNVARKSRDKRFILCEGYMDVISLHQYGFKGAFASLGTALTVEQAELISSLYRGDDKSHDLYLIYDSDSAGINASVRAVPILRSKGISARIVDLTPLKDPDEFCKTMGAEAFEERLKSSEDGLMFTFRVRERDYDLGIPSGKNSFINNVLVRALTEISNPVERDIYLQTVCGHYNIDPKHMAEQLKRAASEQMLGSSPGRESLTGRKNAKEPSSLTAEKQLLTWMVENPRYADIIRRYITENDFSDHLTRRVFKDLMELEEIPADIPAYLISRYEGSDNELASFFQTDLIGDSTSINSEEKNLKQVMIKVKENTINRLKTSEEESFDKTMKIMELQKALSEFKKIPISI